MATTEEIIDYTEITDHRVRAKICEIISEMLDNPDEHGIFPTSRAMWKLESFILAENARLRDVLETILNQDFAGQTTLSAYGRRIIKQALKGE